MNSLGQLHQTVPTLIPLVQGVGDTALRVPLVLGLVEVQQVGMAVAHNSVVLPGLRFPCAQQLRVLKVFEPLAGDVDASVLEPVPHTGTVGHGQQESLHLLLEARCRLVGRHALLKSSQKGRRAWSQVSTFPSSRCRVQPSGKLPLFLMGASHCFHQLGRCKSAPAQESAGDALEDLVLQQSRGQGPRSGKCPRARATPTEAVGVREVPQNHPDTVSTPFTYSQRL